jgi:Ca2+-binding RTX toxin-like protein
VTGDVVIDLSRAGPSEIAGRRVFIAPNTVIEKAIGGDGNDTLIGNAADNTLWGGRGNDLMDGGAGRDTVDYSGARARVFVNLGQAGPQDTHGAGIDTLISIENLIGSDFDDRIVGSAADNIIWLGKGNDVVFATGGFDQLDGGEGTDTVDHRGMASGVDVWLIDPNVSGVGLVNFENLTGSYFADTLRGHSSNNVLSGLAGDDILEGLGGTDRLDGGEGLDLASYASAGAGVTVHLRNGGASSTGPGPGGGPAGIDYFVSIEGFIGSNFNDTLVGDAGPNVLQGGFGDDRLFGLDGDDVLRGGAGYDLFYGGAGSDTADYSDAVSTVRALLGINGTFDTISHGRDWLFDIENLAGGSAKDFLTGDAKSNVLTGNGGNDVLAGLAGDDTLLGGAGNDDMSGGLGTDLIVLGPPEDNDIIRYTSAADSRLSAMDRIQGFTQTGLGFDRIGFENAAGALFAGVAPTAIALGARVTLAAATSLADLAAQLAALAASSAAALSVTQVTVQGGAVMGDYVAVNDPAAGFDAASDMLIGVQFAAGHTLTAGNFFLF